VGYGQTEASPGICLGEKGIFYTNYIGNPLGCKIKISNEGELFFKGDNSYFGYWENGSVKKNSDNSWIRTGDIVEKKKEGLFFKGRLDFSFKLPNGILIQPEEIEESLKIKVPEISNCLLFNSNELHLLVSTYEPDLQPRLVKSIKENMSPILKNSSIKIDTVSSSDWFFSPKGGIDRKKMIQKFK
jgi:long-subunit acyl-CoA synthetase (AMP-forming)